MVRNICRMGVLALGLAAGCNQKEAQVVKPKDLPTSEVAVWVDQVGITSGQIQREASRLFQGAPKNLTPEQTQQAQLRVLQQAVDNLVVRQLVKAEMERSGVLISREEVEKGKQDLQNSMGPGTSLAMLIAEANLPMEELEENLRLDLFKNKVLKDKLEAAIGAVTEETTKAFYDEHPKEFTQPAGRLASHILVRVRPDMDDAAKKDCLAKAEGIRKALLEGADFAKLASEASECLSRTRGGALGVIPRGREAPVFEEAVYSQKIGEIGEVVESPVGYHVILVTGEQEEKLLPFDEIKDRLLVSLKTKVQQQVISEYIGELRSRATIKLDGMLAATEAKAQPAEAVTDKPAETSPEASAETAAEPPVSTP